MSPYASVAAYSHEDDLINKIKLQLAEIGNFKVTLTVFTLVSKTQKTPKIMVMGALGRCGTGATDFAIKCGIPRLVKD